MLRPISLAAVLLLSFTMQLAAQEKASPPKPTLDALHWMVGHWREEADGKTTEEVWMAGDGGMMLGMNRTVRKGRASAFESLRIVQRDKQIVYLASPGGRPATAFPMKSIGKESVVFESTENDFPNRILYRREKDKLIARIEGTISGQPQSMEWNWTSQQPAAARPNPETKGILQGIETIVYRVKDLAKAKAWFSDVLGAEPYFDKPFYVGFRVGGQELGLDPDVEGLVKGNNQPAYWRVANCEKAFQHLIAKGARPDSKPQDVGDGVQVATVVDPFGNTIGLIEMPKAQAK